MRKIFSLIFIVAVSLNLYADKLKLNEYLTLQKGSTLYFPLPTYWKPESMKKKTNIIQFDILDCDSRGSCVAESKLNWYGNKIILSLGINPKNLQKKSKGFELDMAIFAKARYYEYRAKYYPAVSNELIIKMGLSEVLNGKLFSFNSGTSGMPMLIFMDVDKSIVNNSINNKKSKKNNPPYFIKGSNCVDHDDGRNGEWLSEMYSRGGVLDSRGCLLKGKQNIETYYARISEQDHYGRGNRRLTDVAAILQQDRANYHKYNKRDSEDSYDNYFSTRNNRDKIRTMLARGSTSQNVRESIRYSNPYIQVVRNKNRMDVKLINRKLSDSMLKKSNKLTKDEKASLLYQLLGASNVDMLKYAKAGIREFLAQSDPDTHFVKKNSTYEHTCTQTYQDYFKCKFGAYDDNGEDEGATVVKYDVVRKNNKVRINKIYPVMMAD